MSEETRKDTKQERSAEEPQANQSTLESEQQAATPAEANPDELEALRAELAETKSQAEENWNQFLRARAELENQRRRAERDLEQAKRQSLDKLASEVLSVRDSLEMGVTAAQESSADVAKLREGSELTLRMLDQALDKFSISELNPVGERFDPERHEAMAAQESAEHEPNVVIHVVQKGYVIGERLLRPAMVIVSRRGEGQSADNSGEGGGPQA